MTKFKDYGHVFQILKVIRAFFLIHSFLKIRITFVLSKKTCLSKHKK